MIDFADLINAYLTLLRDGMSTDAVELFCADSIVMYDNDEVFAESKENLMSKQAMLVAMAKNLRAEITELSIDVDQSLCVFRSRTIFETPRGKQQELEGIHWLRWDGNLIVEDRHYRGEMMDEKLRLGILDL